MRFPVRLPVSSARPTRGALVATLFALITGALVVGYGATGGDLVTLAEGEEAFVVEVGDDAEGLTELSTTSSTAGTVTTEAPPAGPAINPSDALAALSDGIRYDNGLALPPETTSTTEATTTEAPTTAEPTTTTEAPTSSESTETTDPSSTVPDSTDTSTPDSTDTSSTGTTAHPDGYVDAGHGVYVPQVLLAIRYCESRDNYQAANPSSSARGAYQFLTGSWAAYGHAERYGVSQAHLATNAQQDEAALITWQQAGTTPWNASKSCWG